MAGTGSPPVEGPGSVIVVCRGGVLGLAIEAGLAHLGWQTRRAQSGADAETNAWAARVLVVADEDGVLPSLPTRGPDSGPMIAVGLRRSIGSVIRAVQQGVLVVLDGDRPFPGLVGSLHALLLDPAAAQDRSVLLRRLRGRAQEASRLAALTSRERQVLAWLALGLSASDIAAAEQVSLTTVRSHIRAVLAKLGVRSQLAAVAMARRAAYPDPSTPDPGNFVNFDDVIRH